MKTELALSFIFDPTRADDVDRILDLLSYARQRGVPIRGDLDRLDGVRQALGAGPVTPAEHPCPKCQRTFLTPIARRNHLAICQGRAYVFCELGCGATHEDTPQGRGQHRRFSHPKEVSACGT